MLRALYKNSACVKPWQGSLDAAAEATKLQAFSENTNFALEVHVGEVWNPLQGYIIDDFDTVAQDLIDKMDHQGVTQLPFNEAVMVVIDFFADSPPAFNELEVHLIELQSMHA